MTKEQKCEACPTKAEDRWEHGSDFHWPKIDPADADAVSSHPWNGRPASLFGSGRDALRALLAHGVDKLGWKRIFIPSYFCQDVASTMPMPGLELCVYSDSPEDAPIWPQHLGASDAVIVMNFFGLREGVDAAQLVARGAAIIENHTHDPWSPWAHTTTADFCVVALRKTLPVPEGGVVWSPRGRALPAEPLVTDERQRAADAKRAGMKLKSLYLDGHALKKDDYRAMYLEGEAHIASGLVSGITSATRAMINCFPVTSWRAKRRENFQYLSARLAGIPWLYVLRPNNKSCTPMSVVIVTDTMTRRESVRKSFIANHIYPAVLWSLEEPVVHDAIPAKHLELSRRIMSLHCDARYESRDMQKLARVLCDLL